MIPLVSVVMPAFNCAPFVGNAVRSALHQADVNLHVVVVDDGSTDDTRRILESFGDRIELVSQYNRGPGAARNAAIRHARGDYIAFLDADDLWLPGKLAAQVAHLQATPHVGMCYSHWHVWRTDSDGCHRVPAWAMQPVDAGAGVSGEGSGWLYNSLLLDCHILTSTVVMRRSLVHSLGAFDEKLRCGEDYDYWLRTSRQAQIDCMAIVGTLYRSSDGSVTSRPQPVNSEREVLLGALSRWGRTGPDGTETDAEAITQRLEKLSDQFAHAHLWHGDPKLAIGWIQERLAARPVHPKLWGLAAVAGLRCVFGTRRGQGQR